MLALYRGLPAQGAMAAAIAPDLALRGSLAALNATVNNIVHLYHSRGFRAENERAIAALQRILEFLDQVNAVREQARQSCRVSEVALGEMNPVPKQTAAILLLVLLL